MELVTKVRKLLLKLHGKVTYYADATNKSRNINLKAPKSSNVQRKLLPWNPKLN